jgi:hypothetical protein
MREIQLSWCAGFFDGEGHVSCHRGYPHARTGNVSAQLHASIAQSSSNVEVLEYFQSVVGIGKVKGPYPMPNGKPQHRLLFGKDEVETLFLMLKPYLREAKTKDFQHALMGYWMHDSNPTNEDFARAIRRVENRAKRANRKEAE